MEYNNLTFNLENGVSFLPGKGYLENLQGTIVPLTENNLRFLLLLLEGVTEKETIIGKVWREQRGVISESSYYGQLHMLRNAFEQVGLDKNLIKTIPRKGVRYLGQVERQELGTTSAEQTTPLENNEINKADKINSDALEHTTISKKGSSEELQNTMIFRGETGLKSRGKWDVIASILSIISVCWLVLLTYVLLTK